MITGAIKSDKIEKIITKEGSMQMESFTKYGDFSKDGKEFIIKRPDTPRPWIGKVKGTQYLIPLTF